MSRAIVCAGGVNTSYVRAGRGSPIVMVTDDIDGAEARAMIATLARDHVVFAAAPRITDAASLGAWLRGFNEGLGIADAHLMLHASISTILK